MKCTQTEMKPRLAHGTSNFRRGVPVLEWSCSLLPGESWYSQYQNTPHCDCWETDKSQKDFPAPASHSASIAHSSVTVRNIPVKGLN